MQARVRDTVLQSLVEVCTHRKWHLYAAHVRTNHVHIVLGADRPPELVMRLLKAYATRAMGAGKHWSRHGSTVYLWNYKSIDAAIIYTLDKQGPRMATFETSAPSQSRFRVDTDNTQETEPRP